MLIIKLNNFAAASYKFVVRKTLFALAYMYKEGQMNFNGLLINKTYLPKRKFKNQVFMFLFHCLNGIK